MTLYQSSQAKDNCGFGLIAQLDGVQSHQLIDTAITALTRMTHRGAINADGITGDGCGISIQLSDAFFRKVGESLGYTLGPHFAVGQVFLNRDDSIAAQTKSILEEELAKETLTICGWRKVPIDTSVCGSAAMKTLPNIEQIFVSAPPGWGKHDIERRLFMARRRAADRIKDDVYYVVSLSNMMIVYKGLVLPELLNQFYPDLADPDLASAICLFHQRFSTNTAPIWKYAQPFRFLAHNGEINTISANRKWARARQKKLYTPLLPDLGNLEHLVNQTGSDSSSLDNMLEVLLAGGMDIFRALRLLVPPAWANRTNMEPGLKAFYEFNSMHTEPWDGPAGIVMSNGQHIACTLDRNGLRPARYVITKDRILTVASEVGVWDYDEADVVEKDRVGPGEMLAADISTGQVWRTNKIDDMLKSRHPYLEWLRENTIRLRSKPWLEKQGAQRYIEGHLKNLPTFVKLFGVSVEEKEQIIQVMANMSQEATGSMGDDAPIAVLSQKERNLFDYFRQQFAQVTNPPIDPLREKSVMSLETCFGREHNVFQETNGLASRAIIGKPILNYAKLKQLNELDQAFYQQRLLTLVYDETDTLENAISSLCDEAVNLVKDGCVILRLSDRDITPGKLTIHAALATGAVHNRLIDEGLRCDTNIIVETGTARDPHHFAVLIGVGATAIYPYLALHIINDLHTESRLDFDLISARRNYFKGLNKGLLKIMSKMGISTVASYRGAQLFEAVGLDISIINKCFPGMSSRIGGATFEDIQRDSQVTARKAWQERVKVQRSGQLKYVHGGEYHCYNPDVVQYLQTAVNSGDYKDYLVYADKVNNRPIATLRDLMKLNLADKPLDIHEVESKSKIMRRFDSAGMSIGALSPEAHEALAVAMNTIGGRSNSGEGGEDEARYGTDKNSKIKQVASGRFGVTAKYLVNAEVLQIKVAQGAKPGEGGQLPGSKVSVEIAKLRNATPGITLISPPPHHDIYSIEDLAQLIFDLKQVNPKALISVKLVSGPGVGTIAAGVAKAYADMITIAGHDGGTGASPLTSVKYAGTPWEIGLSEAHQALIENGLRDRICLQVDGGLKTGLDVIKGAILGADSFGFGTGPMVALGCKFLRICHLNNCATGVATQNKTLRSQHFLGLPERVINYFQFIAKETQEWLAKLGVASLDELIGRTDLLQIISGKTAKQNHLDLQIILDSSKRPENTPPHYQGLRNMPYDKGVLNQKLLEDLKSAELNAVALNFSYSIKNYDRSVGASVAGYLAQNNSSVPIQLNLNFKGIAGQSFGVWNTSGMNLNLVGDANDYVGKGMSGGSISIYPQDNIQYVASRGAIIGNTCLYGASGGALYAAGQAGERFAVRNSGAIAVVEGVGDHGCEYMTGGTVVVLGPVGENFAAGMTGGIAIVLDLRETLNKRTNFEHVEVMGLSEPECDMYQSELIELLNEHVKNTQSTWAKKVLRNLPQYLDYFMVVVPKATGQSIPEEVTLLRVVK
ncbi:glutamate synthase large subunit [Aliikangiella sp. IMCC44359]|uniref:glutamate synthase large subunit n=1 Tax=Aliikangiella sp. IMCC44359 TaxID=3459125 RepID=UPI00403B1E58